MIVIDYPDVQRITVHLNNDSSSASTSANLPSGSGIVSGGQSRGIPIEIPIPTPSSSFSSPPNSHSINRLRNHQQHQNPHLRMVGHRLVQHHHQLQHHHNYQNHPTATFYRPLPPPPSKISPAPPRPPPKRDQYQSQQNCQQRSPPSRITGITHQKSNSMSETGSQNCDVSKSRTIVGNDRISPSSARHIACPGGTNVLQKRNIFEPSIDNKQNISQKFAEQQVNNIDGGRTSPQKPTQSAITDASEFHRQTHKQPTTTGSSHFHRLSKMRLNLSRRQAQDTDHAISSFQPHSSAHSDCSSSAAATTTVRVRTHPSTSSSAGGCRVLRARSTASTSRGDGDDVSFFSGLPESQVDDVAADSDDDDEEESCPSHDSFQELRDNVRECLEKDPNERTADDLATLLEFMHQMPALGQLPMSIKRQLCLKMVFAVVPHAGTIIMHDSEKIDAWSVVVNGSVRHTRSNGASSEYRLGDSFGVKPQPQVQYHDGELVTMLDDCEFVLVEHSDFCAIMSTLPQHIECEADTLTGEVVREAERRVTGPGNQVELVIIKASADRLIQQLVDDPTDAGTITIPPDSHFVDDFLLMHRVFQPDPTFIVRRLIAWFQEESGKYRDRVARIVLIWLNNHFADWENNQLMVTLLDQFEQLLEDSQMYNQQGLLNITCSVKSRPRTVVLTRSNRDQDLAFDVLGGSSDQGGGIFIARVERGSVAEKNGLKRADEVLEVNGQNFKMFSVGRALDILRESTHLSLTVKANRMGFKEVLAAHHHEQQQDTVDGGEVISGKNASAVARIVAASGRYQKKSSVPSFVGTAGTSGHRRSTVNAFQNGGIVTVTSSTSSSSSFSTPVEGTYSTAKSKALTAAGGTLTKNTVFNKLLHMLRGTGISQDDSSAGTGTTSSIDFTDETQQTGNPLRASRSNPDISLHLLHPSQSSVSSQRHNSFSASLHPQEQAIKVYRSDQSFRYLTVYPETNVRNVIQMALQEFGIAVAESSSSTSAILEWALYECSVSREGVIKQRRLPDEMQQLAERIALNSRFYLKNQTRSENLIPDELAPEVLKESRLSLYTLNAQFIASQLTLQDFAVFASIESTEYVCNLFESSSSDVDCRWPNLATFEDLFNKEMWWVVTEVCCERNVYRRSKLIKKFIKIARHCRDLRNLNSMFAIISGLEKPAVKRLAHSWERVPGKYVKMLADIQQLMDPSRNMSRYRQHQLAQEPPVIPIYPILRKDLTFAHEANPTFCQRLVNFEKLRMIAQIIRSITRLSSVPYDAELINGQILADMELGTIRRMGGVVGGPSMLSSKQSSSTSSRKKLYERMLMLRKVKAYLSTMPVIDSEPELDRISLDCEPPAPGTTLIAGSNSTSSAQQWHSGANSAPARRRLPSPSPSSLSSQSNQSADHHQHQKSHRTIGGMMHLPKFGVESPQAVQKMLALVHNSKVKAQNHAKVFAPNSSSTNNRAAQSNIICRNPSFGSMDHNQSSAADLPPTGQDRKRASLSSNERVIL